jgi:hypothetical protein
VGIAEFINGGRNNEKTNFSSLFNVVVGYSLALGSHLFSGISGGQHPGRNQHHGSRDYILFLRSLQLVFLAGSSEWRHSHGDHYQL